MYKLQSETKSSEKRQVTRFVEWASAHAVLTLYSLWLTKFRTLEFR